MSTETKDKVKEIYQTFNERSEKGLVGISKNKVDELYHKTINKIKKEDDDFKNKQGNYNPKVLGTDEQRKKKYESTLQDIFNYYNKQMIPFTDEEYINTVLKEQEIGEIEEEPEPEPEKTVIEANPEKVHLITEPDLAKLIFG